MENSKLIALVSGGNRGIGEAVTIALARQGVHVLMGCRDVALGEAAAAPMRAEGLSVQPVQLDTTNDASVAGLAALIERDFGHLDILVNNAGVGLDYDPTLTVLEKLERTLEVNVVGTVRVTEAMIPMLSASKAPRIVNVSSELASFGLHFTPDWEHSDKKMPTYKASKAALNSLTLSYADQLQDKGIKVNAICPGYTATAATNFGPSRTPAEAAVIVVRMALLDNDGPTASFYNDVCELPW
ncbi:NAD(P)-dependent dehydrogenase (short-subunit alcohol dehydrogenase family) [Rhodobium orientis]|uniref:Short-chain dehydrogenase n=1 Tax=Rhodobium orientis TaxID=34017 RepID=A0A327JNY0_9HYPH|nr:SDR family oxidoreductase [Rhodobium orientis]MBB4302379.1 NAD(P)-dependent dehydrogenase (short-subunit alcohol dehydrogenase family) [Rhodobium orientis]MBK5949083.1 short-chain dehydrogenase [Rhodobium orientis]RAI26592.1 short-chain dehydrogenase [Rhodobium orientis]